MNKIILSFIVVVALSAVSCKKSYNCVCTTDTATGSTSQTTVIDDTNANATKTCNNESSSSNVQTVSCALQ